MTDTKILKTLCISCLILRIETTNEYDPFRVSFTDDGRIYNKKNIVSDFASEDDAWAFFCTLEAAAALMQSHG